MPKYLDINGLSTLWAQITNKISQENDNLQKDLITIIEKEGPIVSTESIEGLAIHPVSYIEPVQEGEGNPSLDNVRPISGWDSVNVTRTGKNLANLFDFNQTVRDVAIAAKDGIVTMNGTPSASTSVLLWKSTLKPGTYTLSHKVLSGSMINAATAASILSGAGVRTRLNAPAATFTVEEETEYSFSIILAASTVTYDNFTFSAQLEQGDTATDFEPPNMQTLTIEFSETVYGGYANLATGVCVKTYGFVELTGNENMTLNNSATLGDGITIKGILPAIGNVEGLCSHAITSPYLNTKNALTIGRSNASWIYWTGILDTLGLSTVDEFKDWVVAQKNAGTPVQIVYGINTPETFQFTPQYFTTIDGINNVWSNCGNTKTIFNLTPASMALATTTENGLMSATDKTKLDGIDTGANKTVVDTALNSTSTNPVQNKVINSAISEKQNTITGAATTVTDSDLNTNRALISNSSGKIAVSAVTSTELGYLDGVTSAIQTQLNGKVPTSRTINGKALTGNITLTASDIGIDSGNISDSVLTEAKTYTDNKITELKGANGGLAELDANGRVPSSQLPSYVDDVLDYANLAGFPATGESGKIYIAQDTNKSYRWSGSTYVEISSSLALGETSSTAYRGDRGAAAYEHAVTNKGIAKSSGLYKITTNSEGHVTAATAVAKADITKLGIPAQDTTYSAAGSSLGLVKSGGDVTISDGVITVNDNSHAHTIENINNLQTVLDEKFSLSSASNLGNGTDLNDITTPRAYYAIADDAKTMLNCPVTLGFKMVVMQGYTDTRSHQLLFTANSNSIFYRMRNTNTWTEWVNLSKTTLSDLGITATATELNYVDGVTSNVQTQINNLSTLVGDTAVSEQIDEAFNDVITGFSSTGSASLPVYFNNDGKPTVITSLGLGNKTSNGTTNITLTRKVRDTAGNNYSVFKVAPLASAETIDIDFAMYDAYSEPPTISSRNQFRISLNSIYPAESDTKNIGSASNKWANIYATTFHGALEGNATTATNVAWSGVTDKPFDVAPALTSCTGTLTVDKGGTGATTPEAARTALGITLSNLGDVVVSTSTPTSVTNGTWYLVKQGE